MGVTKVVVLEGPDGSGKTTLARVIVDVLGGPARAAASHHGPYLSLGGEALSLVYAGSLVPALLGDRHAVLDRSWLSELPYGRAARAGADRLGDGRRWALDLLARRAPGGAVVVLCLPPLAACLEVHRERRGSEYVDETGAAVAWEEYRRLAESAALTILPVARYDWTRTDATSFARRLLLPNLPNPQ